MKDEGNHAYSKADYGKAIAYYRQALRLAENYQKETEGNLPNKREFGDSPKLGRHMMYQQDFMRLKATILNNMASCFLVKKQTDMADRYNNLALMEDPGYAKAHFRKCTILEARGNFTNAINLAQQCIEEYSHEFESDKTSIDMIPKFQELIDRLKPIKHKETEEVTRDLQEDVDEQLDASMGNFDFLDKLIGENMEEI